MPVADTETKNYLNRHVLERRLDLESGERIKGFSLRQKEDLAEILHLWEGLHAIIPDYASETRPVIKLIINRGIARPDDLLRVDLANRVYEPLREDNTDYPGVIKWLGDKLSERGYKRAF